jgi:hypothetical protein
MPNGKAMRVVLEVGPDEYLGRLGWMYGLPGHPDSGAGALYFAVKESVSDFEAALRRAVAGFLARRAEPFDEALGFDWGDVLEELEEDDWAKEGLRPLPVPGPMGWATVDIGEPLNKPDDGLDDDLDDDDLDDELDDDDDDDDDDFVPDPGDELAGLLEAVAGAAGFRVEHASGERRQALAPYVMRVLAAAGFETAYVTDQSRLEHFPLDETDRLRMEEELGVPLALEELVVVVAQRLKDKDAARGE